MIKPTIGRALWYWPKSGEVLATVPGQPLAAMIVAVWSDVSVNLVVFDANGVSYGRPSTLLVQEGATRPDAGFAEFIPA